MFVNHSVRLAPVISPWESRHIKQELFNARAEIASLQERNTKLFNLKKESDLLYEKEKVALEHIINNSKLTVWKTFTFCLVTYVFLLFFEIILD